MVGGGGGGGISYGSNKWSNTPAMLLYATLVGVTYNFIHQTCMQAHTQNYTHTHACIHLPTHPHMHTKHTQWKKKIRENSMAMENINWSGTKLDQKALQRIMRQSRKKSPHTNTILSLPDPSPTTHGMVTIVPSL